MTYRILVGLPSFNEADSIAKVAQDIDTAISMLPFTAETILVNADNSSIDGTSDVFMSTPTNSPKLVITTRHHAGKGTNWKALLELMPEQGADAALFVDTDLAEVPETWIHELLGAIQRGAEFAYPLRPPTWNGGDLTYQLAYPLLAGIFGADMREPLCGDIALSASAAQALLQESWSSDELRFGVDFLFASVAVERRWTALALATRRRNKLRSFAAGPDGEYRMGAKFAEVSGAIRNRVTMRIRREPPEELDTASVVTSVDRALVVPGYDRDIAELAISTARRLRIDAERGHLSVFPPALQQRLLDHAGSNAATQGLRWEDWRECLFAWLAVGEENGDPEAIPVDLLETLFLNRVVGHHTEIASRNDWYATVQDQADDVFAHRHRLWLNT